MKTDLFQSCGHCWVFQICWHIECSALTASSFRIWNCSAGIPSPPWTLFMVMLPKALLTSHFRMSGSRWVIIPPWLSGSWRSFLYSSSVYSCHLFLISSASGRSIQFFAFIVPIFAWNVPLVSLIFLKRSLIFPILLFSSISLDWSLRKRSIFISIPEKGNAKECSNYHIIARISHPTKVMLKILQARLQQYKNWELPSVLAWFRKGRGTRDQIANTIGS